MRSYKSGIDTINMDIDDTVQSILQHFVKELQEHPQNVNNAIEEFKWKFVCLFAAANYNHNVATTLEQLPIMTCMDAK